MFVQNFMALDPEPGTGSRPIQFEKSDSDPEKSSRSATLIPSVKGIVS
jgi:hypothetical protein